jgi:hypothetical protein
MPWHCVICRRNRPIKDYDGTWPAAESRRLSGGIDVSVSTVRPRDVLAVLEQLILQEDAIRESGREFAANVIRSARCRPKLDGQCALGWVG